MTFQQNLTNAAPEHAVKTENTCCFFNISDEFVFFFFFLQAEFFFFFFSSSSLSSVADTVDVSFFSAVHRLFVCLFVWHTILISRCGVA